MGQGTIRISASVLLDAIADTINLDVLRRRLLLPEHYTLKLLDVRYDRAFSGEVMITLSSPEIPDGSQISLMYQSEPGKDIVLGQRKTTLSSVDVIPGKQSEQ